MSDQPTRSDIMRSFVPESPLVRHLGIELTDLQRDRAELRLPYRPELATMGDVVHGGAIAALLDTAGMAAAWSDDTVPEKLAGATVSMSVAYVAAARASDLTAVATVVRRGRELCFCEVTVSDADDRVVAHGSMVHRYGQARLLLRVADPDERYAAVRLCSDLPLSESGRAYARHDGEWRLELAPPRVARLEYELEVVCRDGDVERVCDPGNPHRAPGAFGEKSVLLLAGYAAPRWLEADGVPGRGEELAVPGRGLGAEVRMRIWSPEDADPTEPLPLLAAHDGPEYDRLAGLTRFAAAAIRAGDLPPHRVAMLAPGERNEWYSASARYAGALVRDVIPAIRGAVAVRGAPVGMGASLGALAMLHAQRRHPGTFGALFLQSGSFFTPRFDAHEARFPRYQRIVRFVRETLRQPAHADTVPVALTCGSAEENLHNNRLMAHALATQGYPAALQEVPDMHNFTAWRDALEPHLTGLLARAW